MADAPSKPVPSSAFYWPDGPIEFDDWTPGEFAELPYQPVANHEIELVYAPFLADPS